MNALYIDTHQTKIFEILIMKSERNLIKQGLDAFVELIPLIESLKVDFDKIIIITGPGSLTSLRIGCSMATGISIGKNIPILGMRLLDLLAYDNKDVDIFFYLGTKNWIHRINETQKIIPFAEIEHLNAKACKKWLSNKPEALHFEPKRNIPYPQIVKLMKKHSHLATENMDIYYPLPLPESK